MRLPCVRAGQRSMIRLHSHKHGPRVYVLGRRIHEWQLGLVVLAVAFTGHAAGAWRLSLVPLLAVGAGAWLVVKDWRDLVPSKRDTSSWRVGLHRRAVPLREARRTDGLPALAASVAFAVGLVNLLSALTPNIGWRHHLLLQLEPVEVVPLFHTLAVPVSVALVVSAFYLRARRRRAWQAALVLLLALGALALLKGFDFEEAALSWAAAAILWWGKGSFYVRHERLRPRSALIVGGAFMLAASALTAIAVWIATRAEPGDVIREVGSLLSWTKGSMSFSDEFSWVPVVFGALGLAAIVWVSYVVFRPLGPPRSLPGDEDRRDAIDLVRAHGRDTLAFFKLREDAHYHFAPDRGAFLGYRVANKVMLISGDPVGVPEAMPELVRDTCAFAETRGLRVAALGASRRCCPSTGRRACDRSTSATRRSSTRAGSRSRAERSERSASRSAGSRPRATPLRHATSRVSIRRRSTSSTTCPPSGGKARSNAASRWRWTRFAASIRRAASSSPRGTQRARFAASSTSCPATAGRQCRCRSCAATARPRTA